ncbi:MAG: hypothetical protein POELPBGB_01935 [Bacteroidia bacterium]|nr:hypothetical protein [Bacteroidia bacterium]
MAVFKQLYVYILLCSDNSYYIGVTNDVNERISYHNYGTDVSAYTYDRRPVKLMYVEAFKEFEQAIAREKQLKKWTRRKKEALINENWEKLKDFAACYNLSNYSLYDKKSD